MHRTDSSLESLIADRPRWIGLARRWVDGQADAEELFASTVARLLPRGAPEGVDLERWFTRVLHNAAIDQARHRSAERRALEGLAHEPAATSEERRPCQCVKKVAERLKPAYAEVISAVHGEEEPLASFARSRSLTVNNATVRLHRARRALRELVEERCGACAEAGCSDCDCAPEPRPL